MDARGGDQQVLGTLQAGQHTLTVRAEPAGDPGAVTAGPVAVLLPAMGVPAGYYAPFLAELRACGVSVVTFDLRGQGEAAPAPRRGLRFGYEELVNDVAAVHELVAEHFPGRPVFNLGHSLGGHLAMLHAGRRPDHVAGVALIAAGTVWFRSFPRGQQLPLLLGSQLVAGVSRAAGYWPGHRFGFGGRQPEPVMRDWARQARTGRYRLPGAAGDDDSAMRALAKPILAVSIDGDRFAPPGSVSALAHRAVDAPRTLAHYSTADAGASELGHFRWARRGGAELARWVGEWAGTRVASAG
ncbi:alpha/beta hydrolase family protein [Salinifilum aidingensis]